MLSSKLKQPRDLAQTVQSDRYLPGTSYCCCDVPVLQQPRQFLHHIMMPAISAALGRFRCQYRINTMSSVCVVQQLTLSDAGQGA